MEHYVRLLCFPLVYRFYISRDSTTRCSQSSCARKTMNTSFARNSSPLLCLAVSLWMARIVLGIACLCSFAMSVAHAQTPLIPTSTDVAAPRLAAVGQPLELSSNVRFTGTSATNPSGTITFFNAGVQIGTGVVNTSIVSFPGTGLTTIHQAKFSTASLMLGTHTITAAYSGDASFSASVSGSTTVSVIVPPPPTATTVRLRTTPQSAFAGVPIHLTAGVTFSGGLGLGPTGTVSFFDGTALVGTAPVQFNIFLADQWSAVLTVSNLSAGTHAITAEYNGDSFFSPSSSISASVEVKPAPVTIGTSFSGLTGTGSGTAQISMSGGGGGSCAFTRAAFIPVSGNPASPPAGTVPPGIWFGHGLIDFAISGCAAGSTVTIVLTTPTPLPDNPQYWKYGPTPSTGPAPGFTPPHWYTIPATINGNTATFTITDGGLGDDDMLANGTFVDAGGPATPLVGQVIQIFPPKSVPVLGKPALISISFLTVLPVSLTVVSGPCQLLPLPPDALPYSRGITATAVGSCVIRGSQAGDSTYAAAPDVDVTVPAILPTMLSLSTVPAVVVEPDAIDLVASVSVANPVAAVNFFGPGNHCIVIEDAICAPLLATATIYCFAVPVIAGRAVCRVPAGIALGQSFVEFFANIHSSPNNTNARASALVLVRTPLRALTLAADNVTPAVGKAVRLTALARGIALRGNVTFVNSAGVVAGCVNQTLFTLPGDMNSAVATCTVVPIVGNNTYTAQYSGDAGNALAPATLTVKANAGGPEDYSDIWWGGASENGWGVSITQKGMQQFNALYVYDNSGKPVWYAMPGGKWNVDFTKFTGDLYQPSGTAFSAYEASKLQVRAPVGSATLTFTDASNATLDYTINGITGSKRIARFKLGSPESGPRIPVKDIWWGGDHENGWGLNLSQQDGAVFGAWYTYDASGKTTWYVLPSAAWLGTSLIGQLFTTTSSGWLGSTYNAGQFNTTLVGVMQIDFIDANNATMTYSVNGITQTKPIYRLPF